MEDFLCDAAADVDPAPGVEAHRHVAGLGARIDTKRSTVWTAIFGASGSTAIRVLAMGPSFSMVYRGNPQTSIVSFSILSPKKQWNRIGAYHLGSAAAYSTSWRIRDATFGWSVSIVTRSNLWGRILSSRRHRSIIVSKDF